MQGFFKVHKIGALGYFESRRDEGQKVAKRQIILKEVGGEFANEYVVTLFGVNAQQEDWGKLVFAELRFLSHETDMAMFQDIFVNEIIRIK